MIGVFYDGLGYSFTKSAYLLIKGFKKLGYEGVLSASFRSLIAYSYASRVVLIWDTVLFSRFKTRFRYIVKPGVKVVAWLDSPGTVSMLNPGAFDDVCFVTCHPYWYREYANAGIRVHGWVPRPVDYDTATHVSSVEREVLCRDLWSTYGRYVFTVGTDIVVGGSNPPRKGFDAYDKMCSELSSRGVKCLFAGYYPVKHAIRVAGLGGLSEYELMKLMRCSEVFVWASRSEGFGMPPVEAMSVGSIVVSSNAPFNSLITGIKFDYSEEKEVFAPSAGMYFKIFDYDVKNLAEAVDYALSMSEGEKEELRIKSSKARELYREDYVAYALLRV
ncbi:MAG: glycosyltransferase [Thermosphaera sp.]